MTIWALLEECVQQLHEPFRRSEIIGWFRRHHPEVLEQSLSAHIQGATAGAPGRGPFASRPPLLERIDKGLYRRATGAEGQAPVLVRDVANVARSQAPFAPGPIAAVLVGCVKGKRSTPAAAVDLYTSALFVRRRAYAQASGLPWFVLSAEHGLVRPEALLEPYDRALADQSTTYREAWGAWVAVKLEEAMGDLAGRTVEVHAGSAYVDALRGPLRRRECVIDLPLQGLRQGEQLAWYDTNAAGRRTVAPQQQLAAQIVAGLTAVDAALTPAELLARGSAGLRTAGLYSWWVDDRGAADLTEGLGHPVPPGLVYVGQAGATRWPSGRSSTNTLWGRLTTMHLGGKARFSTFRRTLAAALAERLGLQDENDAVLSSWMTDHLRVVIVPVHDRNALGAVEDAVLDELDPPLNIRGRPDSNLRLVLSERRRRRHLDTVAEPLGRDDMDGGGGE
jgi:hypothetical protein